MGSTSRHGRARIDPTAPEALGICDGCGKLFNLRDLRFQWDWAGTGMVNRQIRVCETCYDLPQEQLRAITLPPDPPPVWQPRPEPLLVDEINDFTVSVVFTGLVTFPCYLTTFDSNVENITLLTGLPNRILINAIPNVSDIVITQSCVSPAVVNALGLMTAITGGSLINFVPVITKRSLGVTDRLTIPQGAMNNEL